MGRMVWVVLNFVNSTKLSVCESVRWKISLYFLTVYLPLAIFISCACHTCRLYSIRLIAEEDKNKNSTLIAHIANLPGFDASTARFATQYSTRCSPEKSVMEIVPTAAELMLPWRRDQSYPNQNDSSGGGGGGGGGTLSLFANCFNKKNLS